LRLRSFLYLAALSAGVSASLGPRAVLPIANKQLAPDGYSRMWASVS